MDNAGCHPPNITEKFSNIKHLFWPKIETCSSASELLKSVNVLHAIRWVGEAWKNVKVISIKKKYSVNVECYARTSLLYNTAQTDPFADNDEENDCEVDEQDLSELILILSLQGPRKCLQSI